MGPLHSLIIDMPSANMLLHMGLIAHFGYWRPLCRPWHCWHLSQMRAV